MRRALVALLALAAAGCAAPGFDWERYDESVLLVTRQPDGFDLAAEIDALEKEIERTANEERVVPPGVHAHLGYLHSVAGDYESARGHFAAEKALYPESATFMDYLLGRLPAHT